ncbi:hypothetical protein Scep_013301 [Stephania cephalantha]|uniref:Uncharacterized protein n=1 Tax=Stephania cephalantha TaxID=152367 RepID=A0AAP0JIL3_9MAGN
MLGLMLHLPVLHSQSESPEFDHDSLTELTVPSFANSVPFKVLLNAILDKHSEAYKWFLHHGRRFREAKGIIVNTFGELERYAIESLAVGETPKVYAVGPIIDVEGNKQFQFQFQFQSQSSREVIIRSG